MSISLVTDPLDEAFKAVDDHVDKITGAAQELCKTHLEPIAEKVAEIQKCMRKKIQRLETDIARYRTFVNRVSVISTNKELPSLSTIRQARQVDGFILRTRVSKQLMKKVKELEKELRTVRKDSEALDEAHAAEKAVMDASLEDVINDLRAIRLSLKAWIDDSPDGEFEARKKASTRILDAYHLADEVLDLRGLGLTSLPNGIARLYIDELRAQNNNIAKIQDVLVNSGITITL